jgi:hypothetical protein
MYRLNKQGVYEWHDNPNKRTKIPRMKIRNSNLSYIASTAKARGISRSKVFESIILYMLNSPSRITISLYLDAEKKRKNVKSEHYRKIPKLYMKPKYRLQLETLKKIRKVPYTILVDEMILSYRREFSFFDKFGNIEHLLSDKYFIYNSSNELENFMNILSNTGWCKDIAIKSLEKGVLETLKEKYPKSELFNKLKT